MDSEPNLISTARLDLQLVSVEELLSFAANPTDLLGARGISNPYGWFGPEPGPVQRRIAQVKVDPSVNPWLLRAIVERATNEAVGLINFHDRPDAQGMLEVGYRIAAPRRREGFAREATLGLFHWASHQPGVAVFRASISPDNTASLALAAGLGFIEVGVQEDEIDGTEIIFEVAAANFR